MKTNTYFASYLAQLFLEWDVSDKPEVCHHRCAFKLYGEVNSVKKHNYKIWLNDGVY